MLLLNKIVVKVTKYLKSDLQPQTTNVLCSVAYICAFVFRFV